jgi:hypothetical protein
MASSSQRADDPDRECEQHCAPSCDEMLLAYLASLTVEERLRPNDSALRLRIRLRTAAQMNR